jgi:hypothetical protein
VLMNQLSHPHPQSASPTAGSGGGVFGVGMTNGSNQHHLGLGAPKTVNGPATLTFVPTDASRCSPTASLADLEMSPTKSIEAWRYPPPASWLMEKSMQGKSMQGMVITTNSTLASSHFQPHHPPRDYPAKLSRSGGAPPDMKGWDSTHPIHSAWSDEQRGSGQPNGTASTRVGDEVMLGGANAKMPKDKQRQKVVQACEKCRKRKAAVSCVGCRTERKHLTRLLCHTHSAMATSHASGARIKS